MLLPLVDAVVKLLSDQYTVLQLVWARCFLPFLLIVLIARIRHGSRCFAMGRPILLLGRGLLWVVSGLLFSTAIKFMPLADAMAIVFFSAVVLILLSWLLLHERVTLRRWAAVGVGLGAIMIIIRPGDGGLNSGVLFALGAASFYACYLVATRLLGNSTPPLVLQTYELLAGILVLTPIMPFVWVSPALGDVGPLAGAAILACLGHMMIARALQSSDASLLAPFLYSEIVMHVVLGYFVFGDFPDAWTWVGILLIVAVGVYVSLEARGSEMQAVK